MLKYWFIFYNSLLIVNWNIILNLTNNFNYIILHTDNYNYIHQNNLIIPYQKWIAFTIIFLVIMLQIMYF